MSTVIYGPIKAGRAFRRGETNFVDSEATPGEITITEGADDGLIHFNWINRSTHNADIDLIVFPSDASFVPVSQSLGGRMHVLKFSSSDQRHFIWFQDSFPGAFASYVANINGLLDDPEFVVNHDADAAGRAQPAPQQPVASTSTAPAVTATSSTPTIPPPTSGASPGAPPSLEHLAQLRALVAGLPQDGSSGTGAGSSGLPDLSLSDVLSPSTLAPLFATASPEVLRSIFPTLPSDLPIPPSPDVLRRVVESQPFQAQVRALDRALQTGLVGGLVVGLGLPEEAGLGIRPFLDAVQKQAKKNQDSRSGEPTGDSMETD